MIDDDKYVLFGPCAVCGVYKELIPVILCSSVCKDCYYKHSVDKRRIKELRKRLDVQ